MKKITKEFKTKPTTKIDHTDIEFKQFLVRNKTINLYKDLLVDFIQSNIELTEE